MKRDTYTDALLICIDSQVCQFQLIKRLPPKNSENSTTTIA
jgi:hypothetical protein